MSAHGRLAGRVVLITGGTSGIGRAAAALFAREGATVVIAALAGGDEAAVLDEVRERPDQHVAGVPGDQRAGASAVEAVSFVALDVSDPRAVDRAVTEVFDAHGRLDVVYSNAGAQVVGSAGETTDDMWRGMIDVNLSGQFYVARAALPFLARSGDGALILTASELGLVGTSRSVAYCAAKGGVVNMTRALAIDAAADGVRVNCICPGPVDTPMLRRWFDAADDPRGFERAQLAPVLLGRLGSPDEIARAALFLATADSQFMTGATLVVDGGTTSWYGL